MKISVNDWTPVAVGLLWMTSTFSLSNSVGKLAKLHKPADARWINAGKMIEVFGLALTGVMGLVTVGMAAGMSAALLGLGIAILICMAGGVCGAYQGAKFFKKAAPTVEAAVIHKEMDR